ncbi:hypothetical protein [Limnochorda pilosa]|uniref:CopG family transcriptional regulator n=1 Tax=Limnochorda pilosa TaxID=1555112 RepID=A0A0K2SQH6_LIMPI|nr:hypothetical protein [Limnochorda pilosa]BAS29380.1 hypothetical protein LIP_3569 [Limnochorda pilosa]
MENRRKPLEERKSTALFARCEPELLNLFDRAMEAKFGARNGSKSKVLRALVRKWSTQVMQKAAAR